MKRTRTADVDPKPGDLLRVELKEDMAAGEAADAYVLIWNTAASDFAVTRTVLSIIDPFGAATGSGRNANTQPVTDGTRFWIRYSADARRWEIIASPQFGKYKRYRTADETTSPGGAFWTFANTEPADAIYTNPYFQRNGSNEVICQESGWYRVSVSVFVYPTFQPSVPINIGAYFVNDNTSNISLDSDYIYMPSGTAAEVVFGANFTTLENVNAGERVGVLLSGSYTPVTGETFVHSVKMHLGEKMHSLT